DNADPGDPEAQTVHGGHRSPDPRYIFDTTRLRQRSPPCPGLAARLPRTYRGCTARVDLPGATEWREVDLIGTSRTNLLATTWRDVTILMKSQGRTWSISSSVCLDRAGTEPPTCGPVSAF